MKAKRILAAVLALLMLVSFAGCKKSKSKKRGNLVSGKVSQRYSDGEGKTDIYEINSNAELPSAAQQPGVSAANAPPRTLRRAVLPARAQTHLPATKLRQTRTIISGFTAVNGSTGSLSKTPHMIHQTNT